MPKPKKNRHSGKAFTQLLAQKGFSQYKLAKEAGIGRDHISRLASGEIASPEPITLQKIATALGVAPGELTQIFTQLPDDCSNGKLELEASDSSFVGIASRCLDWGEAVDVSSFYGRTDELATLEQWIVRDRCRLITLLGIGGIGKTSLCVKLAKQIHHHFEYVIWRSLRNSPPLTQLLEDLISFFYDGRESDNSATISHLIKHLQQHRCLVVIDQVEAILRPGKPAGHYLEGYHNYGELLKQIGEVPHQSCLLLTSRETPRDVALRQADNQPVRVWKLGGLKDIEAGEIFRERGLSEEERWSEITRLYQGNPLWLMIVCTTIRDVYGNRVGEFLSNSLYLGDFEEVLEDQFNRLSELEKKIMYQLAIQQQPLSLGDLRGEMQLKTSTELVKALEDLGRRSLLEKVTASSQTLFTLQPVVAKYVIKQYR
ncbi:helix-turn-helix domain-containing protein [Microcoleus sp. FACHB-831]|uniref:helix-turn-helix domain-containing protein n=1 Tax=Microcoleus sp. FACHB-831 TaxID=2692827 RepID=UPI001683134B|nr:helix-turn-helix domain-containing protein [Microcoleus sp. FACHB-831]MBD1921129.1 helix-turn-helix domain-containing protein [Microcoleus sp. FACHB-831]